MPRQRLDQLIVQRGLAESSARAQRLIRAGRVTVGGQLATKPGHLFEASSEIGVSEPERFVGRGGHKLEAALTAFRIDVAGLVCVDIGASTGGFTDCLLQHGALRVLAVDVGRGQLHWKLRNDPRVTVMERVNARTITPEQIGVTADLAVLDVAFISLTKVLPAVTHLLAPGSPVVALIKPQFEAGRKEVGKGGVVRDTAVRERVVSEIRRFCTRTLALAWEGVMESPLRGPAGNTEYLAYMKTERAQVERP